MKNILKGIVMVSLVFTVASCGLMGGKEKLIAKSWELDTKAMMGDEGKKKDDLGSQLVNALSGLVSKAITFDFRSDGTFNARSPLFNTKAEQVGKWSIDGNDLVLKTNKDGEDKNVRIKIVKLTSNKLVLAGEEEGKEVHLKPKDE